MNNVSGYGIEFLERYIDIVKDYISLAEKYEMDDKGKIEEEALRFAKIVTGYELGITSSLKEEVEEEVEEEVKEEVEWMSPAQLGDLIGVGGGTINQFLIKTFFQVKLSKHRYCPTILGKTYCRKKRPGQTTLEWDKDWFLGVWRKAIED